MTDAALDLFGPSVEPPRENADPHPVILTVHPREWRIPFAHQWEAEYEFDIEHPVTCSGAVEECPVQDYLESIGIDEEIYQGFPEPDHLDDDELAVLDGTVRYITMARHYSRWSTPDGVEYDCDWTFDWSD